MRLKLQKLFAESKENLIHNEIEVENFKNKYKEEASENANLREKLNKLASQVDEQQLALREKKNSLDVRDGEVVALRKQLITEEDDKRQIRSELNRLKGEIETVTLDKERVEKRLNATEVKR